MSMASGRISKSVLLFFVLISFSFFLVWNELMYIRSQLATLAEETSSLSEKYVLQNNEATAHLKLYNPQNKNGLEIKNVARTEVYNKQLLPEIIDLRTLQPNSEISDEQLQQDFKSQDEQRVKQQPKVIANKVVVVDIPPVESSNVDTASRIVELHKPLSTLFEKLIENSSKEKNVWERKKPKFDNALFLDTKLASEIEPPKKFVQPSVPKGFPKPLPDWDLLPNDQVVLKNLKAFSREGILSNDIVSLNRSGRGVLFNAVNLQPLAQRISKVIVGAMRTAKMMRLAIQERGIDIGLQFILFTEKAPYKFMVNTKKCVDRLWPECSEFSRDIGVFDFVKFYEDLDSPVVVEKRPRFQLWPDLYLKRIISLLYSPFAETLVVDNDVYPCSNFENLFTDYMTIENDVALAVAVNKVDKWSYAGAFRSGFPQSYANFQERSLGIQLLATGRPHVIQLIALFRDVYIRHINDTQHVETNNAKPALREALFTMQNEIREQIIPPETVCRFQSGCPDGCYIVHRSYKQNSSKIELAEHDRVQIMLRERRANDNASIDVNFTLLEILEAEYAAGHTNGTAVLIPPIN